MNIMNGRSIPMHSQFRKAAFRGGAPGRQRGTILVVSLLLLLVMTVLALSASQTTRLQERMAGNARDLDLAFQAAEAGLREAEFAIDEALNSTGKRPNDCGDPADCDIQQRSPGPIDYSRKDDDWWNDNGREYGDDEQQIGQIVKDPIVYTEVLADIPDSLTVGRPGGAATAFYAHTSRSLGGTETATTVLQTVQAIRYTQQ
jgi:type IV pilus assembly protein PilX